VCVSCSNEREYAQLATARSNRVHDTCRIQDHENGELLYFHVFDCLRVFGVRDSATPKSQPLAVAENVSAPQIKGATPPGSTEEPAANVPMEDETAAIPNDTKNAVTQNPQKTSPPEDPRSIEGYGKTRWGMTEEEVIQAEAGRVERLDKPEPFGAQGKPPIDIGRLKFKRLEIDGREYTAYCCFDPTDNRLSRVIISSFEAKGAITNNQRFASLEQLLTEKYGSPAFSNSGKQQTDPVIRTYIVSWKLSKTSIQLVHDDYGVGFGSVLKLVYEPLNRWTKASNEL